MVLPKGNPEITLSTPHACTAFSHATYKLRALIEDISRNSKRRAPRDNPEAHSAFEDLMIH
jgi:hypothetical protein